MPLIDCDNEWPAFDGCMLFWQPFCIINCCRVIVFTLVMENKLSLYTCRVNKSAASTGAEGRTVLTA